MSLDSFLQKSSDLRCLEKEIENYFTPDGIHKIGMTKEERNDLKYGIYPSRLIDLMVKMKRLRVLWVINN